MKILTGDVLGFPPDYDIWHNMDGRVVGSMHQPHFTTKEIPWYSFLFEVERTPRLLTVDRGDIQGAYWELKPKPPILCHGAPIWSYYITQLTNHILFTVLLCQNTRGAAVPCNTHRKEVTLQLCTVFFTINVPY